MSFSLLFLPTIRNVFTFFRGYQPEICMDMRVFIGKHVYGFLHIPKGVFKSQNKATAAKSCKSHWSVSSFYGLFLPSSIFSLTAGFLLIHCTTANLILSVPKQHSFFPPLRLFACHSLCSSSSHDKLRSNVTSWYGLSLISQSKEPSLVTFYHMCH